jgi:hypothetical protein
MILKLLYSTGAVLLLIAGIACAGDVGSFAELRPYSGNAGGRAGGPGGFSRGRVDFDRDVQYSRGMASDTNHGVRTSYTYAVRLPDGRVIANNFDLSVAPGDTFFGSSHAEGGYAASAGGRLYGYGTGTTWAHSVPSGMYPAYSQAQSRSFPY